MRVVSWNVEQGVVVQHVEGREQRRRRAREVRDAGLEQRPRFADAPSHETRCGIAAPAQPALQGLVRVALRDDRFAETVPSVPVPHLDDDRLEVVEHGVGKPVGRAQGDACDANGDGVDRHSHSPAKLRLTPARHERRCGNTCGPSAHLRAGRPRSQGCLARLPFTARILPIRGSGARARWNAPARYGCPRAQAADARRRVPALRPPPRPPAARPGPAPG